MNGQKYLHRKAEAARLAKSMSRWVAGARHRWDRGRVPWPIMALSEETAPNFIFLKHSIQL